LKNIQKSISTKIKRGLKMITCSVCGHLNDSSRATCENCGSDLSDSPDWGVDYDDDLNYDDFDEEW
jgi:formate dehydrogenase maturation protein FdhE